MNGLLDALSSIKTRLGALVAVSVVAAVVLTLIGSAGGVPPLLVLPVSVALALGVTQLLAAGMVAPLRQMTTAAQRMARGDYGARVHTTATDEVGQLAVAFNQMAQDLATVDRERRDLIATVSHELRTPLTAMTALLENLADGVVPADAEHLGEALSQAERLRELVADLLELSRLEAGVVSLQREPVRLAHLVEQCAAQVQAAGRQGAVDVDVPAEMVVEADPRRLAQLLRNVLDNAHRHAPADVPVRVAARTAADRWWLEVSDDGPGVAAQDRERVFERFGADPHGGGTGLGLAVSRWVAQLHGGTLRFTDPPQGSGARLRLEVPSAPAQEETMTPAPMTPAPMTPAPMTPAPMAPPSSDVPLSPTDGAQARPTGLEGVFGRFWPEAPGDSGLRTVLAAAAAGTFGALVMSFTEPGISWTLLLLVAGGAALATSRRRREPWTLSCAALAALLVLPLTLLSAWWIGMVCTLAAAAVFLCGLTGARSPSGIVLTGLSWPLASLRGLPWFGRSLRLAGVGGTTPAVVRTMAWSLLALAVFGAIFASADAVFASWVDALVPSLTFSDLVGRVFVGVGIFALTLAAAYLGLNPSRVDLWDERRPPVLTNRFEWLAPVIVVDVVFLSFLASQAATFFGGHDYVERTTGLTYADNVHRGFGQLTLATALTLLVVWTASRRASRTASDRWWLRGSLGALCAMTLVVVASALHRMHLYQEAYGFTTLRVFVDVFEGWLGFVVLAVMVLGAAGLGRWLPRLALVSGAVALLGLAAVNPEAWVADRNVDRYEATGELDLEYLELLSPDAAPVIAERLPADVAACTLHYLSSNGLRPEVLDDWRAWNLGRERGADVVRGLDMPAPEDGSGGGECAEIRERFER